MEFGIFNSVCVLPRYVEQHGEAAEHDRIMDEVAYVEAADKAGFKYAWVTEHHFLTTYSHLSANESFLAYAAARTNNIHLGSGIFNITPPVNHPARIAERVAMLDHLSGGRFEFGTGRGSSTTEQKGFGIEDSELTREMVAETLPQIVRMWKDEEYSYDGKFFTMPPRNVLPKPFSKPHPPIWMAAGSPGTFDLAAELGVGVLCFGFSSPEALTPLVSRYKEKIEDCKNPVGGFVNNNVMVTTQMLCMEDGAKARKVFLDADTNYFIGILFHYLDTFPRPAGIPDWPQTSARRHARATRRGHRLGRDGHRHPRRGGARRSSATSGPGPTSCPSACCRPPSRSRTARKRSRRSASTCSRSSTRTPFTRRRSSGSRPSNRSRRCRIGQPRWGTLGLIESSVLRR